MLTENAAIFIVIHHTCIDYLLRAEMSKHKRTVIESKLNTVQLTIFSIDVVKIENHVIISFI